MEYLGRIGLYERRLGRLLWHSAPTQEVWRSAVHLAEDRPVEKEQNLALHLQTSDHFWLEHPPVNNDNHCLCLHHAMAKIRFEQVGHLRSTVDIDSHLLYLHSLLLPHLLRHLRLYGLTMPLGQLI